MMRRAALIAVPILVGWFALAEAQGSVTSLRLDCLGASSGSSTIHLFRDAVVIAEETLRCADGGLATTDVVTAVEPNGWSISPGACGPHACVLCAAEAGTRFPAVNHCGNSGVSGTNTMAFRPRPAN